MGKPYRQSGEGEGAGGKPWVWQARAQEVFKIAKQMALAQAGLCRAIRVAKLKGRALPCSPGPLKCLWALAAGSGAISFRKAPCGFSPPPFVAAPSLLQFWRDAPFPACSPCAFHLVGGHVCTGQMPATPPSLPLWVTSGGHREG